MMNPGCICDQKASLLGLILFGWVYFRNGLYYRKEILKIVGVTFEKDLVLDGIYILKRLCLFILIQTANNLNHLINT